MRAKFKIDSITDYGNVKSLSLSAVTGGSDENKSFWEYTPAGSIKLDVCNLGAVEGMKAGDEFYVDFTKAEKAG